MFVNNLSTRWCGFENRKSVQVQIEPVKYLPIKIGGSNLFFQLVNAGYEKGTMMERETDIVSRIKQPKSRRPRTQLGPEKPVSAAETHDDTQPDMFPQEETSERKPDDPEEIAAE